MNRVAGETLSHPAVLRYAEKRRARNAVADRCINDTVAQTHGPIVDGTRCKHCQLVHRHGAEGARLRTDYVEVGA